MIGLLKFHKSIRNPNFFSNIAEKEDKEDKADKKNEKMRRDQIRIGRKAKWKIKRDRDSFDGMTYPFLERGKGHGPWAKYRAKLPMHTIFGK